MTTISEQDMLAKAVRLVNETFVGMLSTVDSEGRPHSRWMGSAMSVNGVRSLFTLTGKGTRKVQQIQRNPAVAWVFSAEDFSDVVTLRGQAVVHEAPMVAQQVWDRLIDCTRTYVMGALSNEEQLEFVAIETMIDEVEILSPAQKIYQPHIIKVGTDSKAS